MLSRDPYFDSMMPERQAAVWASAARVQLGRWERLVAKHCLTTLYRNQPQVNATMDTAEIWQGEIERHLPPAISSRPST